MVIGDSKAAYRVAVVAMCVMLCAGLVSALMPQAFILPHRAAHFTRTHISRTYVHIHKHTQV